MSKVQEEKLSEVPTIQYCRERAISIKRCRKFLPTLIVSPAQAAIVWKEELRKRFLMLKVVYFMARMTLGSSMDALFDYVASIRDSPEALVHVVLTTYETWGTRALYTTPKGYDRDKKPGEEDDGDLEEPAKEATDEERTFVPKCPGLFRRVIADEAQRMKSPYTKAHRSVGLG
ncbi:MAG: hypothetical protein Q9201_001611 [Fulgogasparrea decipioides]